MDNRRGLNSSKFHKKKKGKERDELHLVDTKEEQNRFHYLSQTIGNKAVQRLVNSGFKGPKEKKSSGPNGSPYQTAFERYAGQIPSLKGESLGPRTALPGKVKSPNRDMRSLIINGKKTNKGNTIPPRNSASPVMLKSKSSSTTNVIPKKDKAQTVKDKKTGLPANLKSGIENIAKMDLSDIRVHYNSNKPKDLNAHAFTQGTDIHVAPGQEKHVAHEAWHVVQQKQGRVKANTEVKGVAVNNSKSLEKEADIMGAKAQEAAKTKVAAPKQQSPAPKGSSAKTVQRKGFFSAVGDFFGGVGDTIGGAVDAVGEAVTDAGKAVGNAVVGAGKAIGNAAVKAGRAVKKTAKEAASKVGETAEQVGTFVGEVVDKAAAFLNNLKINDDLKQEILAQLDKVWPENVGYIITGQLGATFGIPLYLGGEGKEELFHAKNHNYQLTRSGRATVAADTGAGAEASFDLGPIKAEVSAKAEAQAGVKLFVSEGYNFPVLQDKAFEAFMATLMSGGTASIITQNFAVKALVSTLKMITGADAYRTKFVAELAGYGAAAANATGKIQFGGDGANPQQTIEEASETGSSMWKALLPIAFARAGVGLEAGTGLEVVPPKENEPFKIKLYVKAGMSAAAGAGASILKLIKANFNVLDLALEAAPYINGEIDQNTGEIAWTNWGVQLHSHPTDSMAALAGPGTSIDLNYNINREKDESELATQEETLTTAEWLHSLVPDQFSFEKRAGIGGGFGKGFTLQNRQFLNTVLPGDDYKKFGAIISGTYTFKINISKQKLHDIIDWIAEFAAGNEDRRAEAMKLWQDLVNLLTKGTVPSWLSNTDQLAAAFKGFQLIEAKGRFSVGFAVAANLSGAVGAKAKVHGGLTATRYNQYDLFQDTDVASILNYISSNLLAFLGHSDQNEKLQVMDPSGS